MGLAIAILLSLLAVSAAERLKPPSPQVNLGYSTYQGIFNSSSNVTSFLGIRFAAPPLNELRWRAPQPPHNTSGIQLATNQPPQCYQPPVPLDVLPSDSDLTKRGIANDTSEDCLYLNVYSPGNLDPSKTYPVIVWIHGGGYNQGRGSYFNGEDIVVGSGHGIVTVIIQYRLSILGFLSGSQLQSDGDLNVGLLDQEFAFKWVQENIAKFGGDKSRVTIWGESAGAGSVLQHVVAHGGKTNPPLFQAAITSSTYFPAQYNHNHWIPESIYARVVNGTGCSAGADRLACLRKADISSLDTVAQEISAGGYNASSIFLPVVDGSLIVERPTQTLSKGHVNGRALLSVTNSNEGSIFVNTSTLTDLRTYVTQVFPIAPSTVIDAIAEKYGQLPGGLVGQAIALMGESTFICPSYFLQKAFPGRAWKGEMALPPANHEIDIQYYFTSYVSFVPAPKFKNVGFQKAFARSFFSVVKALDPNLEYDSSDIRPFWPAWNSSKPIEMLFNKTENDVPAIHTKSTGDLLDRCNFWQSIAPFVVY